MKKLIFVVFFTFLFFASVPANAGNLDYVDNEIIVKYKNKEIKQSADSAAKTDIEKKESLDLANANLYVIKDGKSVQEKIKELENNSDIEFIMPNYIAKKDDLLEPNDTYYSRLWGMHNMGQTVNGTAGTTDADVDLPQTWDTINDASDIVVAVVDTGVNGNHPDLSSNMWINTGEIGGNDIDDDGNGYTDDMYGYDFVSTDILPYDVNGHGTHVAGTIGAVGNNNDGVVGAAWDVKIMPVRVLDESGYGTWVDIALGVEYAVLSGADIINMSLGGSSGSNNSSDILWTYLDYARQNDVLVVVAAGNTGTNNDDSSGLLHHYPCDYTLSNILCVAATNQNDSLASFSSYGPTSVDVAAPGTNIYSTHPYLHLDEDFENLSSFSETDFSTSGSGWEIVDLGVYGYYAKGKQQNNLNSIIQSDSYDTSGESAVGVEFYYSGTIYSGDYLRVDVWDGFNWNNGVVTIDSTSDSDDTINIDATQYANLYLTVRFIWHTNSSTPSVIYLDDIKVYDTKEGYYYLNGTSMATPLVSGIVALVKSYANSLGYSEVKSIIMGSAEEKSGLINKVVSDGRVNAYRAIESIISSDTTDPTGSVSINNSDIYTQSADVTLSLSADDDVGVSTMRISNDNRNWSGWETYKISKSWTINNAQGTRNVYVQFKDIGNNTITVSDSIILDRTGPTISVSPNGGIINISTDVELTANEAATIYYTTNGATPTTSSRVYSEALNFTEDKTLKYFGVDLAGNTGSIGSTDFTFINSASIITAAGPGGGPHIRAFDYKGDVEDDPDKLFAFDSSFRNGVHVASCDIDGDGVDEIIAGTGPGQPPYVRVFEKSGSLVTQFLAYAINIEGGVYLACGDLDGNGRDEIITGVPEGFGPHVRVFDGRNGNVTVTAGFFAYAENVRTGIRVAAGDLDGDGKDEIVTGTGYGAGTHVRTFTGIGGEVFSPGFFVYGEYDRTGINVAVGDLHGSGKGRIITGSGYGKYPIIAIYDRYGNLDTYFYAYPLSYIAGVKVAAGDVDGDGEDEIITGTNPGGGPQIRVFERNGDVIGSFFAYDDAFRGGVDVAVGNLGN